MTQTKQPSETVASLAGKWKPYPAYKNSGIEWLGEIPEHWEVKRLKYIACLNYGDSLPADVREEGPVPVFGSNGPIGFHSKPNTYAPVIVVGRKGSSGKLNFSNQPCFAVDTTYYIDARSCEVELRWLFYALSLLKLDAKSEDSAIPGLSRDFVYEQVLPSVSLSEQRSIANFLDRETTKINTLIAKNERLIELLQEKRSAVISQAVTKGLDPNVPMKDSGIEWLREIPAHWGLCQFKRVAEISYGLTLELDRTETEGTSIISLPNVTKEGQLLLDDVPLTPLTSEEKKKLLLRKGDLLFNWRNGSPDHVGKTAYFNADGEYTHVSFLLRIRFNPTKYSARYYQMFLNNLRNTAFFASAKHRVNKTYNQTELGRLQVMVPPFEEQKMIAVYLDHETAKIDALISTIREAVEKLKEYSTALISAAVTGKIDVRERV